MLSSRSSSQRKQMYYSSWSNRFGSLATSLLISLFSLSIASCGGKSAESATNGQPTSDDDLSSDSIAKPYLVSDLVTLSYTSSVPDHLTLSGRSPTFHEGKTKLKLTEKVQNGWAVRELSVVIFDQIEIEDVYYCKAKSQNIIETNLDEPVCFIEYANDSYVGRDQTWYSGYSECLIYVSNAVLGDDSLYKDFDIEVHCTRMRNAGLNESGLPIMDMDLVISDLDLHGRIYAAESTGIEYSETNTEGMRLPLSISGGDGVVDSNIEFQSDLGGFYSEGGEYIAEFESVDNERAFEVSIFLNSPYEIQNEFECVLIESVLSVPNSLDIDKCLVVFTKYVSDLDDSEELRWVSDQAENCIFKISRAELNREGNKAFNLSGSLDCQNMISTGKSNPNDVTPSNLSIKGNIEPLVIVEGSVDTSK